MTWTVFQHNEGPNETREDAPGRGGYTYVLVPQYAMHAAEWWQREYGEKPTREHHGEPVWALSQYDHPDDARQHCGTLTLDAGGIGVPQTRYYTWNELNGRLDVRVVTADEL